MSTMCRTIGIGRERGAWHRGCAVRSTVKLSSSIGTMKAMSVFTIAVMMCDTFSHNPTRLEDASPLVHHGMTYTKMNVASRLEHTNVAHQFDTYGRRAAERLAHLAA
jgi:hypothetical protein